MISFLSSSENYKGSATKYLIYFLFIIDNVEHMFELLLLNMRSIFLKRQKFRFFSFFSRSIFSFLFSSIIHGIYCICVFALSFPMALGLLPVVASTSTAAAAAASVSRHTWTFYQSPNSATKYRLTNCRKESLWLHLKAFWPSVETMRLAILESLL